jgi:glycosyltransferase involved in cell wall biosynthesis
MDEDRTALNSDQKPLISCLMVSRGEVFPARLAILCYQLQTYPNRELIIVSAQPESPLSDYVDALGDATIRYIESPPLTLGDLRNTSAAEAGGSFLCIWDDDDLYHRERLARQYESLCASGAAAHFLSRLLFWWPDRRLLAVTGERPWENSMLVRRDALPAYPSKSQGEDTELVEKLTRNHAICTSDHPDLYCYIVHGRNTCTDSHFEYLRDGTTWTFSDYDREMARIAIQYPVRWYQDALETSSESDPSGLIEPEVYSDRHFGPENLWIDGARFENCDFEGTTFSYAGGAVPAFDRCTMKDVRFDFASSAANTVELLRLLTRLGVIQSI